jgi:hypothetical protein
MIIQDEKPNHYFLIEKCRCELPTCDHLFMVGTPEEYNNKYMITIERKGKDVGLSAWFTKDEMLNLIQQLQDLVSLEK